ncbi:MAG: lytic transglycosylase domain-containing protein [Selenomonas ruminantium]|jgi:soluble lytic murein transglycosylase-like protein|nr:lytic transglycosylase domain-containing protein [Selenomonas ruminantium]
MTSIDLSGVRHIQARIAAIQEQFGIPGGVPGMDFDSMLNKAMHKGDKEKALPAEAAGAAVEAASGKTGDQTQEAKAPREVRIAGYAPHTKGEGTLLSDASLSQLVKEASDKYQVDPKLVSAVAEVESGGNQGAQSPAGAIGVMQLMPDTAASLGVNPYDKQQNIEGGAKYLRQMLDSFGGDVKKAVAAYNAGPNAVKKYGGIPPYPETQSYVDKVLDLYQ